MAVWFTVNTRISPEHWQLSITNEPEPTKDGIMNNVVVPDESTFNPFAYIFFTSNPPKFRRWIDAFLFESKDKRGDDNVIFEPDNHISELTNNDNGVVMPDMTDKRLPFDAAFVWKIKEAIRRYLDGPIIQIEIVTDFVNCICVRYLFGKR